MRIAACILTVVLLAACGSTPDQRQAEAKHPAARGVELRVLAAEDGPFATLNADEYPEGSAARYRWLELSRADAVNSSLMKTCPESGARKVPVQIIDEYNITGADIIDVQPATDSWTGGMAVALELSPAAAGRMQTLTSRYKAAGEGGEDPRLLALVIDNRVYAAYAIRDIMSGPMQITGNFSARERDALIQLLRGEEN